ncbi:MAG TPA: PAS domain-containing protein [bacterium]
MKAKILIASQDLEIVKQLSDILQDEGHKISSVNSAEACLDNGKSGQYNLIFIDAHAAALPYTNVIPEIKKQCPDTEIIVITGYAFPEAMAKAEVQDIISFLILPITGTKVKGIVSRVLHQNQLVKENRRLLLTVTAAKKEWEATVDAIEDPIFVTDFDYTILRGNLATFRKLGKGVSEVIGHKCYKILHCSDTPPDDCPGKKARDSGEPDTGTMFFKGLKQRLTCSVYPQVFAGGGGLVHYLREPAGTSEQQAEAMAKYERLFDDASIPILVVDLEDYKVMDANQRAIELFGRDPEHIVNVDLENIFTADVREATMSGIIKMLTEGHGNGSLKTIVRGKNDSQVQVQAMVNRIEVGAQRFIEIFLIPQESA